MRFEHLRRPAVFVAVAILSTGAIAVLLSGMAERGPLVYIPVLVLGGLVAYIAGGKGDREPRVSLSAALSAVVLLAAVGFRLSHLRTVQLAADWGETWIFYEVAEKLLEDGLFYEPYHHYFHTLYAYIMAGAMAIAGSHELGYRVSSAAVSIVTVFSFQRLAWAYAGPTSAWIGTAFFASSFWHLWASRVGGHKFLLPLFQILTLLALLSLLRRKSWTSVFLLGLWLVLGLHAYWGYYIMPFVCIAAFVSVAIRWPALLGSLRFKLAALCLGTLLASAPLASFLSNRTQANDYVASKLSFPNEEVSIDGLVSKLGRNFRFLAWAYSGDFAAGAHAEFAPFVGVIVAVLLPIGLARSLLLARRSPEHLILALHTAANVAGIVVTWAHNQYIIALMPSVFLYAGLGGRSLVDISDRAGRLASRIALTAMAAAVGAQMTSDYRTFFEERLTSDLRHPYEDVGANHPIPEELRRATGRSVVFVPFSDRRRELGGGLEMLQRLGFPEYGFVSRLLELRAGSPVFPMSEIRGAEAITALVPLPDSDRTLLDELVALHPRAVIRDVVAPEPYRRRFPRPMAALVEIPVDDAKSYSGPEHDTEDAGRWTGYLVAMEEGPHTPIFEDGKLEIGGREVRSDEELFLETGLHEAVFRGKDPAEGVRLRDPRGRTMPIVDRIVHGPDDLLRRMLGADGARTDGRFLLRRRAELVEEPLSVAIGGGSAIVSTGTDLFAISKDSVTALGVPADAATPVKVASRRDRIVAVDRRGLLYEVGKGFPAAGSIGCEPVSLFSGEKLLAHCRDRVVEWDGYDAVPIDSNVPPAALLAPAADGLYFLDPKTMRMTRAGSEDSAMPSRKVPRIDLPIGIQRFRNLLLISSREKTVVYDGAWHRIVGGTSGPLFSREDGSEVNPGRIVGASGSGLVSIDGKAVSIFEWKDG